MAKYAHPDVLDGGLLAIKNGATMMVLVKAYTAGDSYATLMGNALAAVTMAPTDYALSNAGTGRKLASAAGKTATATAAAVASANDHHIAFTDGSSRVLWVTDETGEAGNAIGDTVTFPASIYTSNQLI